MYPEFLFFAKGMPTKGLLSAFIIYRIIGGIGVGLASAICPMYIAEVSPPGMRGRLVSWNQFAIIFGQLVVYFVNLVILGSHVNPVIEGLMVINPEEASWATETGWRYMFGSEAVPAGLFSLLICLVPESPRYLVLSGKDTMAFGILERINGTSKAEETLLEIKSTAESKTERMFAYGWLVIFIGCT